jgi:TetR/AcrR family transcriptional regulator, transcriptional repressor for nem operon
MLQAARAARPKASAGRDPARTREALLAAAFGQIHRAGFRGSDVETILHEAGVTKGALYHHFDSKEALGYAVVDEVVAAIMRSKWVKPLARAEDAVDALVAIVASTPVTPKELSYGCPLNNLSQEMSPLDEGFRQRTAKLFDEWRGAIETALRQGKQRGTVGEHVEPRDAAIFLIAAYEGYLSLGKCFRDACAIRAARNTLVGYLDSLRPPAGDQPSRRRLR